VREDAAVKTVVLTALGLLMLLAGGLWTLQGLGYVGGSAMSGESSWAVIGPLVAGLGVALVVVALDRRRH
jgi:hypothetical protein